jgi:phosphatidylglycerol:prolipoprotein diacylglycerol transferase
MSGCEPKRRRKHNPLGEGISIGPIFLRWSGLLVAFGIASGALLAAYETKRRNHDPELIYYLFLPVTMWGMIGARLWHILTPPLSSVQLGLTTAHYLTQPLDMLALWVGGFGIPGAILGGAFGLFLFSRKYELPFWEISDPLAPGVALALAIGRLGNYFNQELYGLPTNPPLGIFIQPPSRLFGYEQVAFYHPLFAYEAALNIASVMFLLWLARSFSDRLKAGDLFLVYLGIYSVVRFLLEYLRLDVALVSGVNGNQVFFAVLFVAASGLVFWRHRPA